MLYKLSELLILYTEKNVGQKYEPVAVGRYGIRLRSDIFKKELSKDISRNKVIHKDTLVIGMGSKQIDVGVLTEDNNYSVSPAYHTFKIVSSIVNSVFLELLMKAKNKTYTNKYMIASARQGKKVNVKGLLKEEVDIPSLEEQQQIIDKIAKINEALKTKQHEYDLLDELVKARFVEMFGKCKKTIRLGDCCSVHARIGWQALTKKEHKKTGEYMLITGTDFKNGEVDYNTCAYVEKERYEMDKHIILKNDDVLITKDGTIGKVAIVHNLPKPATLNGGVFVVRPDDRFNKAYVANVFEGPLFVEYIEASKTGATIKHLNQKYLVEFKIPVPSKKEQDEFADFVKQVDKSKFACQESIKLYQELLDKKMDEYFNPKEVPNA